MPERWLLRAGVLVALLSVANVAFVVFVSVFNMGRGWLWLMPLVLMVMLGLVMAMLSALFASGNKKKESDASPASGDPILDFLRQRRSHIGAGGDDSSTSDKGKS